MEGQAVKSHCAAAAAGGFLRKSGGGGRRREGGCFSSSSSWTPCNPSRFLHNPKKRTGAGGRISVERTVPPLRSLPPLMSLQDQFVEEGKGNVDGSKIEMYSGKSRSAHVKFVLQKACSFGEKFFLVGDDPMIGLWDLHNAIPLNWSQGHFWTAEMDLPLDKKSAIQFKFILRDPSGEFHWQPGPDRVLQIWETSNTIVVTEDWDKAENQKITEEEEEEQLTSDDQLVEDQVTSNEEGDVLLVCGLTSIPVSEPIVPNEAAAAAAENGIKPVITDLIPNEEVKAAINEKPLDNILLFTSEIEAADEVNV